mmetsp:Transcript_1296/g.3953  ORF Transcript_1296/g.3953 Transcript_1296/m.3953 type:complete len:331 (+) Transcript_1296:199-1191(+)|eukprot:CAMPEP_0198728552 /NCGR_PEP_ID=MMETSP1475-20131203/9926_1 /TAXON_ID= ORGANISM="Unidentified sp., Strain CCMP1999" /NCGR_SAMPLE_ID=MMETSP1475 /ASSEMBLY_ACC=CAM_ASM_001111 /LENGTH=330 /DNA_ID=CAMNT_0044490951 /DNA_START=197 /DNA_END=1189 /DNA_ORIENTATION=+
MVKKRRYQPGLKAGFQVVSLGAAAAAIVTGLLVGMFALYCLDVDRLERRRTGGCGIETVKGGIRRKVPTALAMMEATGEHWVREMVERVTQRTTGSMSCNPELRERGLRGECEDYRYSVMALTYAPLQNTTDDIIYQMSSAVYVPRNPFDTIACRYFMEMGSYTEETLVQLPLEYVIRETKAYKQHYLFWSQLRAEKLVLKMEEILREPEASMGRLAMFLGIVVDDAVLQCARHSAASESTGVIGRPRDLYFSLSYFDHTAKVFVIEYLRDVLCDLGYLYDLPGLECGVEWRKLEEKRREDGEEINLEREFAVRHARPRRFSLRQKWGQT